MTLDAAAIAATVPAGDQRMLLEGHEVRRIAGAPFAVGIRWTGGVGDSGLRCIGYAYRRKGAAETP